MQEGRCDKRVVQSIRIQWRQRRSSGSTYIYDTITYQNGPNIIPRNETRNATINITKRETQQSTSKRYVW